MDLFGEIDQDCGKNLADSGGSRINTAELGAVAGVWRPMQVGLSRREIHGVTTLEVRINYFKYFKNISLLPQNGEILEKLHERMFNK